MCLYYHSRVIKSSHIGVIIMKFTVGLAATDTKFVNCILENKEHIYEVYFSWGDFANGRNAQSASAEFAPWEIADIQRSNLKKLSENGIALNMLFNANCYGSNSQSRAFFDKIGTAVDYVAVNYGLASVTTTSPLIAKFIKNNFDRLDVRASVNMEIGTVQGMRYLEKYFDSYYIKRELNRNISDIRVLHEWAATNGKKLFMLANSGCLNYCSAHIFHDNLVAHESEIAKMDNAYNFTGMCHEFLSDKSHYDSLINDTNFVLPEDIHLYEPYVEAAKLATRVHRHPELVLRSYVRGKYIGDVLRLLEPEHSIYPYVVENGKPLRLVRIDEKTLEY